MRWKLFYVRACSSARMRIATSGIALNIRSNPLGTKRASRIAADRPISLVLHARISVTHPSGITHGVAHDPCINVAYINRAHTRAHARFVA